jgi:serine/threonine protein kinase
MGVTYKAFDTNLRVPVALKVINGTYLHSDVARQRFVREARSAAKLRHRNVATVYHLGTAGEAWFYAMEFIDGETVDALIKRRGPLEPVVALQIAAQVARALNAAVPHGLVHRDLKPANLMLVREDDDLVVKVIDFGLAKSSLPGEDDDHVGFVGTPHFASPEQLREEQIDVRSDIYNLGVTLWFMLAGRAPFAGSMEQVKKQHLTKPPPFEQFTKLPSRCMRYCARCWRKDAAKRHQTPQGAAARARGVPATNRRHERAGRRAWMKKPLRVARRRTAAARRNAVRAAGRDRRTLPDRRNPGRDEHRPRISLLRPRSAARHSHAGAQSRADLRRERLHPDRARGGEDRHRPPR